MTPVRETSQYLILGVEKDAAVAPGLDAALELARKPGPEFVWVDLVGEDAAKLEQTAADLGLHELARQELLAGAVRPRLSEYPAAISVTMNVLRDGTQDAGCDRLTVVVLAGLLVTVRAHDLPLLDRLRDQVEAAPDRYSQGPAWLLHFLCNAVTRRHLDLLEEIDEALAEFEQSDFAEIDSGYPARLFAKRREVTWIRRKIGPHRELFGHLGASTHPLIPGKLRVYLRDTLENCQRIDERLTGFRELLQGASDLYMAGAAQRSNDVMTTLSVVATVVLPLNILTGLYGTNFETLPGAKTPGAFWIFIAALAVMALATGGIFRSRGWL